METKKALNWIKEHKKEILLTTGTIIGVGVLGYFGVKASNKIMNDNMVAKLEESAAHWLENPALKLDHVTVTDVWKDDGCPYTNTILNDFTAADMGKVGEELMANIPEITNDTMLTAWLSTTALTKTE